MWTREHILSNLEELHLSLGDTVLVHAGMRSVGPVEGGADAVIEALLEIVGPDGTIMAPIFQAANRQRAGWDDLDAPTSSADPFDQNAVSVVEVGILAERIRLHPEAR